MLRWMFGFGSTSRKSTSRKQNRRPARIVPSFEALEARVALSITPYVVPTIPDVTTTPILTVGESAVNGYRMAGIPDGLGAFDNNNGTFTVLMNHELQLATPSFPTNEGVARTHNLSLGAAGFGAFVSEWVIRKSDLAVLSGQDLIVNVYDSTGALIPAGDPRLNFSRFCSADLAPVSAFSFGGLGTTDRIYMNGEETAGGRAFAHIVTGAYAHNSYELGLLGRVAFENSVANPYAQAMTIVASTDDTTPGAGTLTSPFNTGGRIYIYIGTKTNTGTPVEKAGLTNGTNYAVQVGSVAIEARNTPLSGRFTLVTPGGPNSPTGGTQFLRPEDIAWDPLHPNVAYFATTDRYDQVKDGIGTNVARSRLYRLTFDNITNPTAGGTIEAVLDGTEDHNMFDNLAVDRYGRVLLQEDPGNQVHNAKIWEYDIATDHLTQIAMHDPALFGGIGRAATAPFNVDEESSGIIDVSDIFGPGSYLFDVQAHYAFGDPAIVEGGQLLLMRVATPDWAQPDSAQTVTPAQVTGNVLTNDNASPATVISHTNPANGSLTLNADGSYSYTPNAGFAGIDSFSYTAAAAQIYKTAPIVVNTPGGPVNLSGFGSAVTAVPGTTDQVYGVTDRGPNVDGPGGIKIEPIPNFNPAIARYKLVNGQAIPQEYILLKGPGGEPYNGQAVSGLGNTNEVITDLDGTGLPDGLPATPWGYDPEGIVAVPDGPGGTDTFWVSDEYGPFITHFAHDGTQLQRLAPGSGLPKELALRRANRGMEGLTITPDGTTLVGIMQSPLMNGFTSNSVNNATTPVRIVTYRLADGEVHEYLYLLNRPVTPAATSVSEIMAQTNNTTFLVDERDGEYTPGGTKKLYTIDLAGATDVGPSSTLINNTTVKYDQDNGGLLFLVSGVWTPIEKLVASQNTGTAANTLSAKGVIAVGKTLFLDVSAMLKAIDPAGGFFSHDKLEGLTMLPGGKLVISNDSDFGIAGVSNASPPFQLTSKTSPVTGEVDNGEFLVVDLAKLATTLSTTTVTIKVVYDVQSFIPRTEVNAGSTLPIEVQVKDSNGNNVGSSDLQVKATGLVGPGGVSYPVECPGNSNPDGLFRYDPVTRRYKFNLKTSKSMPTGLYTFSYTVGDDPTIYTISFELK